MVLAEGGDCPVICEWLKLEAVATRAASGTIALVRENNITRTTVADNYELLIPLVTTYGIFPADRKYMRCSSLFLAIMSYLISQRLRLSQNKCL